MAEKIQTAQVESQLVKSAPKSKKAQVAKRSQAHIKVEDQLVKALLEQLPYYQLPPDESSQAAIFAKFIDSLARINSCRDELIALGFSIGLATISYDSPPNHAVRVDSEKKVAAQYFIHLDAPVNNAGAHLGSLPPEEVREYLTPVLNDSCRKIVEQFIDGLVALVGRQLIGMADWPSENAVKYWYCRHRVTAQAAVTTKTSKVTGSQFENILGVNRLTTTTQYREAEHIPTTLTREVHHHDAIEANSCDIAAATVVIPENVKKLIAAIPDWMRPSIRVADGYMIRTRVDQKQVIGTAVITQVRTHEETTTTYLHGTDPALLLGNLVLIGWGPDEIEQECKAERERKTVAMCVNKCAMWGTVATVFQALLLLLSSRILIHPLGVLFALATFGASVFCMARCLAYGFRAKAVPHKELTLQLTLAGPVLLFAGLQTMAIPGSVLWKLLALPIACVGGYLIYKSPFFRSL